MTQFGRSVLDAASQAQQFGSRITLAQITAVVQGCKNKLIQQNRWDQLPGYGQGKGYTKLECERILHSMVAKQLLIEEVGGRGRWKG